jgi:hypothetical protein
MQPRWHDTFIAVSANSILRCIGHGGPYLSTLYLVMSLGGLSPMVLWNGRAAALLFATAALVNIFDDRWGEVVI